MKKLYDLCVVVGSYTQNGQEKAKFSNVGFIGENNGKRFIALKAYFNPAAIARKEGSEYIFLSMLAPKDNNSKSGQSSSRSNSQNSSSQQWNGDINSTLDNSNNNSGDVPF